MSYPKCQGVFSVSRRPLICSNWDSELLSRRNHSKVGHLYTWHVLFCYVSSVRSYSGARRIFFWTLIARNISRVLHKSGKLEIVKGTDKTPEVSESGGGSLEIDGFESQLLNEQDLQIEAAFCLFDTDGNGALEEDEMRSALFALGYRISFEGNISTLDSSQSFHIKSKKVDLNQFKKIMQGKIVRRSGEDSNDIFLQKINFGKLRHAQTCNCFDVKLTDNL